MIGIQKASDWTGYSYECRIGLLNINLDHIAVIATLPFHHRDPFDRLIIAQAMVKQLTILRADTTFDAYGLNRFW